MSNFNTTSIRIHQKIYGYIQHFLASRWFQPFVVFLIAGSIASVALSSFREFKVYSGLFFLFTFFSAFIFSIEYLLRIISAPIVHPEWSHWKSRRKYIFSFFGFVDFVAILPFLLAYFYWGAQMMNLMVLAHIFIIFKLIRYSSAFQLIGQVLSAVHKELWTAFMACAIMVGFSATLIYYVERSAQPVAFENIGDALWWAIVTFTTVGYGDIYPITPLGRFLSGFICLIGIGMIALPTGLISSAFMNILQQKKSTAKASSKATPSVCPHCGKRFNTTTTDEFLSDKKHHSKD